MRPRSAAPSVPPTAPPTRRDWSFLQTGEGAEVEAEELGVVVARAAGSRVVLGVGKAVGDADVDTETVEVDSWRAPRNEVVNFGAVELLQQFPLSVVERQQ